jgi:2'-5' RNA ligase
LQRTGFDARYESPEKYHITLAFLGYVGADRADAVTEALRSLSTIPTLRITLDRLGGFPHERRPRVVVIGARDQGRAFAMLARRTRDRYAELGFAFDKDPVAHVTVARVKAPQHPLPMLEVKPIPVEISTVSVFESLPDPARNTSRYEIREFVTLALAAPT